MSTSKANVGPVMAPGGVDAIVTIQQPVAASQVFYFNGSMFFYLDSSGYVVGSITATQYVCGWALCPVSSDGTTQTYWTSSTTAGTSKVPCIMAQVNPGCVFRVPTTAAGGLSVQARVGECADLVGDNASAQYVTPATNVQDILIVVGVDPEGDTNACLVTFNPEEMEMET